MKAHERQHPTTQQGRGRGWVPAGAMGRQKCEQQQQLWCCSSKAYLAPPFPHLLFILVYLHVYYVIFAIFKIMTQ